MSDTATELLADWQRRRLDTVHANRTDYGAGRPDLTVLTYYWGADADRPDTQFFRIESAVRETWLQCGLTKTVIVTDRPTREMLAFAALFPQVEIQTEPSLVAGSLYSMSVDCNSRLRDRFDTPYVLTVQDDGFPLRPGIDEFIGKWDFIGAPYVRDKLPQRIIARLLNYWVMNGGFSLRSKRICALAAELWPKFSHLGHCTATSDDIYYTETLIMKSFRYGRTMKLADNRHALRFSYDDVVPFTLSAIPFGFHRATTFETIRKHGLIGEQTT